jgi:hypothetical protein
MKSWFRSLRSLFVFAVLGVAVLFVGPVMANLQLAEILADPASDWNGDGEVDLRDDEWIEVHNAGAEALDLTAYYIRDALGEEPHINLFGILAPGEAAVFYGHMAVAYQQEHGLAVTGLSLNNTGDTLELWRGHPGEAGSQLVDAYIYLDHEAEDDRSSGRMHAGGTWALFDGLNPYDGATEPCGTRCDPTPGVPNDCHPLAVSDGTSWGRMKADYR